MRTWAEVSIRGMLVRAVVAWVLITPLVAAARIWLSPLAAALTGVVGVGLYVAGFFAYRRGHNPHPGEPLPSVLSSQWRRWREDAR